MKEDEVCFLIFNHITHHIFLDFIHAFSKGFRSESSFKYFQWINNSKTGNFLRNCKS